MLQSVNINIDNQAFTFLPSKMIPPLSHFFKRKLDFHGPTFLDKYQNYADGQNNVNNSLGFYANSLDHNNPRGGSTFEVLTNTPASATLVVHIWEQLFIPPLTHHMHQDLGLTNYSNMDMAFIFTSNVTNVLSYIPPVPQNTVSIVPTWGTPAPTLYIDYYTNGSDYMPRPVMFKCDQFAIQTTSVSLPSGGVNWPANVSQDNIMSNSYQFSVIPNKIYIWVQKSDTIKTYSDTDTYFRIDKINLTFGNMTGILTSADTHVLYMMSRKNGLQDSFEEWYGVHMSGTNVPQKIGGVGSVLCLEMGSDIPLTPGFYPGQPGSFNFQISGMTVTNINQGAPITAPIQLYVLLQLDGYVFFGDTIMRETGITAFPKEDMEPVPYDSVKGYYGAGVYDRAMKLMPYLRQGNKFLKDYKIISNFSKALPTPYAPLVHAAAKSLGYGDNAGLNEAVAGKLMTGHELKQRIRKYH